MPGIHEALKSFEESRTQPRAGNDPPNPFDLFGVAIERCVEDGRPDVLEKVLDGLSEILREELRR